MPRPKTLVTLSLGALVLAALAGCVPEESAPTLAPAPVETSASPTPTPTPTPTVADIPVTVACDALLPQAALDKLFSDFVVDPAYKPAVDSDAATFVSRGGVACEWKNSKGETLELAVVNLPDDELTAHKNELVTTSNSVPTYGVEGYFQMVGTTGVADAFDDPFWIRASSAHFLEPGDAEPVMTAAMAALNK